MCNTLYIPSYLLPVRASEQGYVQYPIYPHIHYLCVQVSRVMCNTLYIPHIYYLCLQVSRVMCNTLYIPSYLLPVRASEQGYVQYPIYPHIYYLCVQVSRVMCNTLYVTGYGKTDHFAHNFKIELLVFKGSVDLKQ